MIQSLVIVTLLWLGLQGCQNSQKNPDDSLEEPKVQKLQNPSLIRNPQTATYTHCLLAKENKPWRCLQGTKDLSKICELPSAGPCQGEVGVVARCVVGSEAIWIFYSNLFVGSEALDFCEKSGGVFRQL
jgi:hypothetical protein